MISPLQSQFSDLPLDCPQDRRAAPKHVQYVRGDSGTWKWSFFTRSDSAEPRIGIPTTTGEHVRSVKLARLESVLFITEGALSMRRLAQLATLADAAEAHELIDQLNRAYDDDGCAFRPRCRFAVEKCTGAIPPLERMSGAHFSACWQKHALTAAMERTS